MSTDASSAAENVDLLRVDRWISGVEEEWQRRSVSRRDRRLLVADLQRDIEQARANGASLDALLDADVAGFAQELAEAQGVKLGPQQPEPAPTTGNLILTCLAGGIVGALVVWWFVLPIGVSAMSSSDPAPATSAVGAWEVAAVVLVYAMAAAVTVGCAVGAVWWRFGNALTSKKEIIAVGAGFVLGGLVSVAPVVLFARLTGYSDSPFVVVLEAAIVAGFCAIAIAALLRVSRSVTRSSVAVAK
jgi:hypothetical protein